MKVANIERRYSHLLNVFGILDTSEDLKDASGSLDPDKEFELLVQGIEVEVRVDEDMVEHYLAHLMQLESPALQEMVAKEEVSPEGVQALHNHVAETQRKIFQTMRSPDAVIEARQREAILNSTPDNATQKPEPSIGGNA